MHNNRMNPRGPIVTTVHSTVTHYYVVIVMYKAAGVISTTYDQGMGKENILVP